MNFVHANGRVGSLSYSKWWLIATAYNTLTIGAAAFGGAVGILLAWRLVG